MSGSARKRIDGRVTITVVGGIGVAFGMLLLGMEPRLVLVGFVTLAVGAAAWLVLDLSSEVTVHWWTDHSDDSDRAPRADRRVHALRSRLRATTQLRRTPTAIDPAAVAAAEIGATLVAIVDDHLLAEFGIDRIEDPDAAADVLGADLLALVSDPSARRSLTSRRRIHGTVTLIEEFCTRPHTTPRSSA